MRLTGNMSEADLIDWDKLSFYSWIKALTYQVVTEDDIHYLVIRQDGRECERYPLYYEKVSNSR